MVMIKDNEGIERYSLSDKEFRFAERIRRKINNDDSQMLGVFYGAVGSGKSLKAQHIGFAIDPTLNNSVVCFTKDEFIHAVLNNQKKVIIADEGISMFFSRAAMTKDARVMMELMDQIRQQNLCLFICVPKLLSIDWLVLESLNFVAYVWESRKLEGKKKLTVKGNTAYYLGGGSNNHKMKLIQYLKIKRRNPIKSIRRPIPTFTVPGGRIGEGYKPAWYPVNETDYKNKKNSVLDKYRNKPGQEEGNKKVKRQPAPETLFFKKTIQEFSINNPHLNNIEVGKMFNVSASYISKLKKK